MIEPDGRLSQRSNVSESEFKSVCDNELAEIERRRRRYLGNRQRVDVANRIAIIVDDGIASGATIRAALRATRIRNPGKLILAVPVAPTESLAALREEADGVVCIESHEHFRAIGLYYRYFRQIADEEVIETFKGFPVPSHSRQPAA